MAEYFAPRAKKKLCLSSYENVGNHTSGVFPQPAIVSFFFYPIVILLVTLLSSCSFFLDV